MNEDPQKKAREAFQKAYEFQLKGELEEAVRLYQKSIQIQPTAEAYTFLGWTYSFMGKYGEAIQECHKAIEVDPEFGNPYNDIGAYLIEMGNLDEAIPWFEKAIGAKHYDSYCFPHYNLGRIWEAKGDWMKAIQCYEKALLENNHYAIARKALNHLKGQLN